MNKIKNVFNIGKRIIVGNNEKITFQMKNATIKKLMRIFAFSMVLIGCALFTVSANATSKESIKTQVQKQLTGVKSGSYTYYILDYKLIRVKAGCKKAELIRKNVGQFQISGKSIYYCASNKSRIYRITKDGKNPKLIGTHATRILNIQDGYVYYYGRLGYRRATIGGKKETKILGYAKSNPTFYNNRIYYGEPVSKSNAPGEQAYVIAYRICSIALNGKDKKTYVKTALTQGDHDFTFYELNGILYAAQQGAEVNRLYRLNDKDEFKQLSINKAQNVDVIYTDDTYAYVYNNDHLSTHEDRNDGNIYHMNTKGKQELFLDLKSAGVYLEGSAKLRKESNYWILIDLGDDSYPIVYIFNTKGKLSKIIKIPKGEWGDGATISITIKKKIAYVEFWGESGNRKYKKITLK